MSTKHLPWNPAGLAQVWMRIGAVVWQGQSVEDNLAKLISLAFEASEANARAEAIAALAENRKRTLGALLTRLRKHAAIPALLDARLSEFLSNRNWVVHHSYQDLLKTLNNPTGLRSVIERIESTDLQGYLINVSFWDTLDSMSREANAGGEMPTARAIRQNWKKTTPPLVQ